ncbi:MAG TPA: SRPBCC family protein [Candidatus Limnocylindrales bacterium]|jgi:ribosome-associated toxin RatA of RatAB toxin-antitoxin module|nr:SRPBCC family protein [Candidatus Limnocylindrales bacterium]
MRTTVGIDVAAPPELVFRLAHDVERWPRLLPHYVAVRVVERPPDGSLVAEFVARRPLMPVLGLGLPVAWRSRTWNEPESHRLRFVHRGGATNGMDVTWRIEPTATGCRVSIDHDFRPRVPGWAALVDRLFTRPIAGQTLATFRDLAEAVDETNKSAPASVAIHSA